MTQPSRQENPSIASLALLPLILLILGAFLLRLAIPAPAPFFGDVENQVAVIESGAMLIQFPGYAPLHLLAKALIPVTGSAFGSLVAISQTAGILSVLFSVALGWRLANMAGAVVASGLMGFGLMPLYFSVIGASYAIDMAAAAAILYFGLRTIETRESRYLYLATATFCVAALLRPSHIVFLAPAGMYLFFYLRNWKAALISAGLVMLTVGLYAAITVQFEPVSVPVAERHAGYVNSLLHLKPSNFMKIGAMLVWSLHVWLGVIFALMLFRRRWLTAHHSKPTHRPILVFWMVAIIFPAAINVLHFPYAGYLSIIWPQFVLLPLIAFPEFAAWLSQRQPHAWGIAVAAAVIGLAQFFTLGPVPTKDRFSLAANVLVLQYTWDGVQSGMFETFSSLAARSGILRDRIPMDRLDDPRIQRAIEEGRARNPASP